MRRALTSGIVLAVLLASVSRAATIYVNGTTGNDTWDGLCEVWDGGTCGPKATIQAGIGAANGGDTVLVADGTYSGAGNKNLDYGGKAITVRSENGPASCIIDCGYDGRAFYFHSGETHAAVLEGFTITNGYTSTGNGGGIDCTLESSPTIANCDFLNNQAYAQGGGIACRGVSLPVIKRCTFVGNLSQGYPEGSLGGGVTCFLLSDATITDCIFYDNQSDWGGGLDCSGSYPTVTNCLFVENSAFIGGGAVYCSASDPVITNCTMSRNQAFFGGALVTAGAVLPSYPVLTNCILWNDGPEEILVGIGGATVTYSTVQGGWPGVGNIDDDPVFVGETLRGGIGDYRLHRTSPCIDAGNNYAVPAGVTTDLDGNPRFTDDPLTDDTGYGTPPIVDMGAYEFQRQVGDMNCDGVVNSYDIDGFICALSLVCDYEGQYPTCGRRLADINGDGDVNAYDIDGFIALVGGG